MLDAFIIEELRRREKQRERQADDHSLRLPVPDAPEPRLPRKSPDAEGVHMPSPEIASTIVIDF